jgi:RNA polymerase sigma factor (TIGR02999 family)
MTIEGSGLTDLLLAAQRGGPSAWTEAMPVVYQELKRIAAVHLHGEQAGNQFGRHILQPTALVHEAWLKLVRLPGLQFENRLHFFSICSRLMRQILVDQARHARIEGLAVPLVQESDATALDEALDELAKLSERQCRIVEMRYFAGMSIEEIGSVLELSPRTVKRDWSVARTWLYDYLHSAPK